MRRSQRSQDHLQRRQERRDGAGSRGADHAPRTRARAAARRIAKGVHETAKTKVDQAKAVGKLIAKNAKEKGIETVVFDRGGFLYHGRVKALAESARESGLKF